MSCSAQAFPGAQANPGGFWGCFYSEYVITGDRVQTCFVKGSTCPVFAVNVSVHLCLGSAARDASSKAVTPYSDLSMCGGAVWTRIDRG